VRLGRFELRTPALGSVNRRMDCPICGDARVRPEVHRPVHAHPPGRDRPRQPGQDRGV